jgi:hypothetical protein
MAADGDQVQRYWKVSTLKVLDRLDVTANQSSLLKTLVETVIDTLRLLLDDRQITQCQDDLRKLFTRCIDIGKTAERDHTPILISRIPVADVDGWLEFFDDLYEGSADVEKLSTPIEAQNPQYLTPKVYRPATATTQEHVICPGSALFPKTGIFQQGREELEEIKKKTRELGITIAKGRKASTGSAAFAPPPWHGHRSSVNGDGNALV